MIKRRKQRVQCAFCGKSFWAVRNDARRCSECRHQYRLALSHRPENIVRKANRYRDLRKQVIAGYGGKCSCCGEDRYEFMAIDHVNGGGREERKTMNIGMIALKIIREGFPSTYRILCHNCNQSIGWYGYCPHQKRTA